MEMRLGVTPSCTKRPTSFAYLAAMISQVRHCPFLLLACLATSQVACQSTGPAASMPKRKQPPSVAAASEQPSRPAPMSAAEPVAEHVPEAFPSDPFWLAARDEDERSKELCARSATATFPVGDRPSEAEQAKLPRTDSRRLYYGIGVPVDYVAARHAAFVELDRSDSSVFGDATILLMLYANGYGTPKNIDLAIKLACELGGAPMEIAGRVQHLDALRTGPGSTPFDFCDDVTSGFMEGHCEGLSEERRDVERVRELHALAASWPKPQRELLRKLRVASEAFWQARAGNELDLSGTARGAIITQEEAAGRQALLDALRGFERGDLPQLGSSEYALVERELNRAYRSALTQDLSGSTITPEGIRATEKRWIVLRDAWLSFGALRYPEVPPEAWKVWLSSARTAQLKELWL